jgi:hypothetical protein
MLEARFPAQSAQDRISAVHALAFRQSSDEDLQFLLEAVELRDQGNRKGWEEKQKIVWVRLETAMSEAAAQLNVPAREWRG